MILRHLRTLAVYLRHGGVAREQQFTNNQVERDLHPTKTQLEISGCHRAETTAKAWLRSQTSHAR